MKNPTRIEQAQAVAASCNKALKTKGSVYLGSEHPVFERIPTGILALDYVLGGGLVRGQLVQLTGEESAFKTTAAVIAATNAQALDDEATVLWVAGEGFSKMWAERWGMDLDRTLIITADAGDTSMETMVTMLESGFIDVAVIDSIQSLGTEREVEGGVDSESYAGAGAPQMWGRVMRRMLAAMNKGCRTAMISISQVRSAIGKRGFKGMPPEPEGSGIHALKHWKAVDIRFKKGEPFFEGEDEKKKMVAREFKVKCAKNKVADSAERVASFKVNFGAEPTVDNAATAVRLGTSLGLIGQNGAWYVLNGERFQGAEGMASMLRDNPEWVEWLTQQIMGVV